MHSMAFKERKDERFSETGKVLVPDLCIFPGLLIDISAGGCRIRFPTPIDPNTDFDYQASFVIAWKSLQAPFVLILQPRWKKTQASGTEIGFEVLHSPGTKHLISYIEYRTHEDLTASARPRSAEFI